MRTLYMLKRAETAVRTGLESRLRGLNTTPGQYTTLSLLKEDSQSSADLARKAGVTPQSMSETIATLIRKGHIERAEKPEYRRILTVSLTVDGHELLARCDSVVDVLEAELLADLQEKEVAALRGYLRSIVKASEAR